MRKCKICAEEKELEKFRKIRIWFSYTCKICYAKQYRTGKENTGRFKKGMKLPLDWIERRQKTKKEPKTIEVKNIRVRKKSETSLIGIKLAEWKLSIKKRDGFMCQKCGIKDDLHAHHIIPVKEDKNFAFEMTNGITLCRACHSRTERLLESSKRKKG